MKAYGNLHIALEKMRVRSLFTLTGSSLTPGESQSNARPSDPPRVLVIGPTNSGKTTLCKTLINYCVRAGQGWSPILVNIDPMDVCVELYDWLALADLTLPPLGRLGSPRRIICRSCAGSYTHIFCCDIAWVCRNNCAHVSSFEHPFPNSLLVWSCRRKTESTTHGAINSQYRREHGGALRQKT
jgi:hypothetical protein